MAVIFKKHRNGAELMKKSYVIFIVIIMVLSLFTYLQERDLTKIKAENETLKSELYDLENDLVAVNSKLKDKEEAFDALKDHYKLERETRDLIDAHVRAISDAIETKDIEYLKLAVSSDVEVMSDRLVFEDGLTFPIVARNYDFVLEQSYYTLYENNVQFFTEYMLINDSEEYLRTYRFEFVNEKGMWKLKELMQR